MSTLLDHASTDAWSPQLLTLDNGATITVLTKPAVDSPTIDVLPQVPQLVYTSEQAPVLSLSLILSRQPEPTEDTVIPLINRGLLALTVQTGVTQEVLNALSTCSQQKFQRLFARRVEYTLLQTVHQELPGILAKAEGSGTEGRAGISIHLDRAQTLDVLSALDGVSSSLSLCATVHYRSASPPQVVQLSGSWGLIHDYLSLQVDEQGRLTQATLQALLPVMVDKGLLAVKHQDNSPAQLTGEQLHRLFMRQAMVILQPDSVVDEAYLLRSRPHESFSLNYSETVEGSGLRSHELCTSLDHLIGNTLRGNWEQHVHLMAQQPDATTAPVPRRVRATPSRTSRNPQTLMKVAAMGNAVTSLSLAAHPNTFAVSPQKLALIKRPELIAKRPELVVNQGMLEDIRIELPQKDVPQSLPVVTNPKAPYWRDRLDPKKLWYAPVLEVVPPLANGDPASSPFLFSFQRVGTTNTSQPALKGTLRVTLQQRQSEATSKALASVQGKALPVPLNHLTVALIVPFVDSVDGHVKRHRFSAAVSIEGDRVMATISLLNQWVRLAYGVVAIEDFQSTTAQVQVSYAFSGYVPIREQDLELAYGGKALHTPVVYSPTEAAKLKGTTFFDATSMSLVQPHAQLRFQPEELDATRQDRRTTAASLTQLHTANLSAINLNSNAITLNRPAVAAIPSVRPQLTLAANVATLLQKVKYARRTQVRQQSQPLLFPCSQFGRFYQEIRRGTANAIGCQDALTLGQTRYQQYEEITELRTSSYQVHRSLQQPGQFLVIPARFCISRRSVGEADAYWPLIFLHALLDADTPANNRVELRTTLQPDLRVFERLELLEKLKGYDVNPTIHYPTDIPTETVDFNWHVEPEILANSEVEILNTEGPFISAYLRMDLPSWHLMRSVLVSPGLSGSFLLELADGTPFNVNLLLKLDHIRGPWEDGPLEITAESGELRLTNRVEQTVEVSDLVKFTGSARTHRTPVEVAIASDQSHTLKASSDLQPVYHYPPTDPIEIEEIRSFVEHIFSNFIFINLLNLPRHNLLRLDVEARVQGIDQRYTAQLTAAMPIADIEVVLPLTTYLEKRVLEFRVTKVFNNGTAETTHWIQWDLDAAGPVSITSELLGLLQ